MLPNTDMIEPLVDINSINLPIVSGKVVYYKVKNADSFLDINKGNQIFR